MGLAVVFQLAILVFVTIVWVRILLLHWKMYKAEKLLLALEKQGYILYPYNKYTKDYYSFLAFVDIKKLRKL